MPLVQVAVEDERDGEILGQEWTDELPVE